LLPEFESIAGPRWDDKPTAIIGAGPSLIGKNLDRLRGKAHIIAVTSALWDYPWADVAVGVDYPELLNWWERFATTPLPVWWALAKGKTIPSSPHGDLHFLKLLKGVRLSDDPAWLCGGGTSGFASFNYAWLKGTRKIAAFGFDYRQDGKGNWHYNEAAYGRPLSYSETGWSIWATYFSYIAGQFSAANVEAVIASPESAVDCFPRMTVEEGIEYVLQE
jgi:hypothetical protein